MNYAHNSQANNYLTGYNIAVVGAVIHLGPEHAASTFAADVDQNAALVKGFGVNQQDWLLKAKSILMSVQLTVLPSSANFSFRLQADKAKSEAAEDGSDMPPEPAGKGEGFWKEGNTPRDDFKRWTRLYLIDASSKYFYHPRWIGLTFSFFAAPLIKPEVKKPRWEPKKWPAKALANDLVLVGWGSNMAHMPDSNWDDKKGGAIRLDEWKSLVARIPSSWHNNPHAEPIPDGEFGLDVIKLESFLERFPGAIFTTLSSFKWR